MLSVTKVLIFIISCYSCLEVLKAMECNEHDKSYISKESKDFI